MRRKKRKKRLRIEFHAQREKDKRDEALKEMMPQSERTIPDLMAQIKQSLAEQDKKRKGLVWDPHTPDRDQSHVPVPTQSSRGFSRDRGGKKKVTWHWHVKPPRGKRPKR